MSYTFNKSTNTVYDSTGKQIIPSDDPNSEDIQTYRAWILEGNSPVIDETPAPEEVLRQKKEERAWEVDNIRVTIDGMVFDGDEVSQDRMSRAIIGLNPGETITWVLHNNVPAVITRETLQEALRAAGAAMAEIWVRPYE